MLSAHLETCESCAKFHHQIQQVLLAADDVQLPDDLTPPQPEALARAIMEDLPEQKASPFAIFGGMFKGKEKVDKKGGAPQGGQQGGGGRGKKDTMPPMDMEPQGSRFPHRSNTFPPSGQPITQFEDSAPPSMAPPATKAKGPDDHSGTATRLKAIAKGMSEPLMDSREAQSTTRSLGEKFGMAAGPNQLTDEQPLTLAESIRRKIAESQRATGEHEPINVEDELGPEGSHQPPGEQPNWMKPPGLPNRQPTNGPTGLPGQSNQNLSSPSIQMPSLQSPMQGMPGMPQMPPPMPSPNALAEGGGPQVVGNWGKPSPQESSNWGGPPGGGGPAPVQGMGGAPGGPAMPGLNSAPMPNAAGNAWGGDSNWGADAPKGANGQDADWGPPPAGGAWDDPNDPASSQFAPPTAAPNFAKPGGMNPPDLDNPDQPWNKPLQTAQAAPPAASPAPAAGGWGAPSNGPDNWAGGNTGGWNAPPVPETAAPAPAPPAPAPAAAENNPWPAPAANSGGGANAWGGNANGWQQGQPGGNQNAVPDSWATPPQQTAGGWGQPPAAPTPAPAAQAPQAPTPEPAAPAQSSGAWGQATSGTSWGQAGQASNDSWGGAPTGGAPSGGAAPGGWGQPAGGNAWGSEPDNNANNNSEPAAPAPAAPAPAPIPAPAPMAKSAWSVDAEQIETGTWRAFTPGSDSLVSNAPAAPKGWGAAPAPTPTPAPAMPPPPAPGGEQNRWDVPIQDRGAQPAADANQNRWDTPIQNRGAQDAAPQAPAPNNPWGSPAPGAAPPLPGQSGGFGSVPVPPAPGAMGGTGIPKDSIMDRLSNVLHEGQPAQQTSSEESRWDMPIQDRMKQDAMAAGAPPPPPAPAQAKTSGDNRWDMPIQDRSAQQAPELSPPPPRWDVPIQERTQQLTPTTATPVADQLAPQAAAPNPWGAPLPEPAPPAAPAPQMQMPPAPQAMPFGSPADQGITASSWDLPVVEAQDQLHQRAPEPAPPAPFGQPMGMPPQNPGGGSPSRLNINPPAFTPGQPVQPPAPPTPAAAAAASGALFNVDDSEIDKIFSEHLGINEGAPPAAPAKPDIPAPAVMKSLPIAPPEAPAAWGQPFNPPPMPGPTQDSLPQPFAAPAPQPVQPFVPEPQPFATPEPPAHPFGAPSTGMPFAAPEPVNPGNPFAAPVATPPPAPVQPFAMPEQQQPMQPFAAQAPQPFGAPPPQPFATPEPAPQPVQPFGAPPPQPFAAPEPPAQPFANANPFAAQQQAAQSGNPFAVPPQPAAPPKIVPVMSKSVATASGGPPAQGWGAPNVSGGFPAAAPANGQSPVAAAPAPFGAPAPAAQDNKANGLFNLDDSAMDDLFSKNLGVQETARPVGGTGEQPVPAIMQNIPQVAPQPQPQPQQAFAQPNQGFAQPNQGFAQPNQGFAQPIPQPQAPMPFGAPPPQQFAQPVESPQPFAQTPQAPMPFGAPGQPQGAPPAPFGQPFGAPGQQAPAAPAPFGAPPQAPQQAPQQGLFAVDDSMMNQIFSDNLGVNDQDTQVNQGRVNVAAAVQALSDVAQDPGAVPPPKIEGLGRLDAKPDQGGDTGSGRIASIGKFLLDQKDLEKIGKLTASDLSDTKMKILTLEAASEIQGLLHHIGGTPDVVGSIIIGHDGLLIANTMPQDIEADSIGIWALAVYMNTETAIKKIGHNRVHQVVARTPRGFLVIADFGGGLLVTLSDGRDTDALIPLMRSITQVVSS